MCIYIYMYIYYYSQNSCIPNRTSSPKHNFLSPSFANPAFTIFFGEANLRYFFFCDFGFFGQRKKRRKRKLKPSLHNTIKSLNKIPYTDRISRSQHRVAQAFVASGFKQLCLKVKLQKNTEVYRAKPRTISDPANL